MKNPELFHKTVGILVKAYLNDTLQYSDCKACAVGNMVASNMGVKLQKVGIGISASNKRYEGQWFTPFSQGCCGRTGISLNKITKTAKKQIKATGYTIFELADIEYAFGQGGALEVSNYAGTLMLIHEATHTEAQQAKELFVLAD